MLPKYYRVVVVNETTEQLPAGLIKVYRNGWVYGTDDEGLGRVTYEGAETEIFSNASVIPIQDAAFGNAVNNADTGAGYLGAFFRVSSNFVGQSMTGKVKVYLQGALSDNNWDTGNGQLLAVLDAASKTLQRATVEFEYTPEADRTTHA